MKKKWMLVSCVIAGCAVGGILLGRTIAAELGTCTSPRFDNNADCDGSYNCVTNTDCHAYTWSCPDSACNPDPCQARKVVDNLPYGRCYNGYLDWGCVECARYYCANSAAYQSMDQYGECQQSRCTFLGYRTNACVPT